MSKHSSNSMTRRQGLFEIDEHDGIAVLNACGSTRELLGLDLDPIKQLWDFFAHRQWNAPKVIVLHVPPSLLGPENIDEILTDHHAHVSGSPAEDIPGGPDYAERMDFSRTCNAVQRLIRCIRGTDAFVIVTLGGHWLLSLLGPALACDFRIASDDTVFVNRMLDSGFSPIGGVPWFLSRMLGRTWTWDLLMRESLISARHAYALGLVNYVVPADRLKTEAMALARELAGKPRGSLTGLKRTMNAAQLHFDEYLEVESETFERSTQWMKPR